MKKIVRWAAIALAALTITASTGCEPADSPERPNPGVNRPQDIIGLKCIYKRFRAWEASYQVRNSDINNRSKYVITIAVFQTSTNKVQDTAPDTVRMGPGKTVRGAAGGFRDDNRGGASYCRVVQAIRTRG